MNFGEAKTYLRSLINRKDISDALASQFIQQAQDRVERQARTASMQKLVALTPVSGTADTFDLPDDFLALIDVYSEDREAERVDMHQFIRYPAELAGKPCVFVQIGKQLKVRPWPSSGSLPLHYYAAEPRLGAESSSNEWTKAYSDVLTYGAAVFAAHHYEDERLDQFEAMFQTLLGELKDRAWEEDFSGPLRLQPAYSYPEDY